MNDTGFEARLHQLVFPQVRSKAPRLVPMMVGFELLDVNDDETEAAGVYAFRVGAHMVFVPVFFRNGNIKGLNLMYLDKDDLFLPLEDDWVDYIINRQPFDLGKLVDKSELHHDNDGTFKNVADAFGKTAAKCASAPVTQERRAIIKMANLLTVTGPRAAKSEQRSGLDAALPKLPKVATARLLRAMTQNDDLGRSVLRFYPLPQLAQIGQKVAAIPDKVSRREKPTGVTATPYKDGLGVPFVPKPVALTSDDTEGLAADVTDAEREEIRRDGVAIRDGRAEEDVTKVFRTSAPTDWFSPTQGGVYRILDTKGQLRKAVVLKDIVTVGEGIAKGLLVIADGDGGLVGRKSLTATEEFAPEEFKRWLEDKSTITEAGLSDNDQFVLVNEDMQATPVLRMVGTKQTGPDGVTHFYVDQRSYVERPRSTAYTVPSCGPGPVHRYDGLWDDDGITMEHDEERTDMPSRWAQERIDEGKETLAELSEYDFRRGRRVTILGQGETDEFHTAGGQLICGPKVKVVKVTDRDVRALMAPCNGDLWPMLKQASAVRRMTVNTDGQRYRVRGFFGDTALVDSGDISRKQATIHLVRVHGFNKHAALDVLKDAELAHAKHQQNPAYAVKYAASFPDLDIDSANTGEEKGISESEGVVDIDEGAGNPFLSNDIKNITNAARTGQKSVFDTTVLMSLLRRHDVGAASDELLGDITIGLDRIGRLLFLLYAHRDSFEEQYGAEDVPQLEDSLENLAKEVGETLLFLKKKSIETTSGEVDPEGLLAPVQ